MRCSSHFCFGFVLGYVNPCNRILCPQLCVIVEGNGTCVCDETEPECVPGIWKFSVVFLLRFVFLVFGRVCTSVNLRQNSAFENIEPSFRQNKDGKLLPMTFLRNHLHLSYKIFNQDLSVSSM